MANSNLEIGDGNQKNLMDYMNEVLTSRQNKTEICGAVTGKIFDKERKHRIFFIKYFKRHIDNLCHLWYNKYKFNKENDNVYYAVKSNRRIQLLYSQVLFRGEIICGLLI